MGVDYAAVVAKCLNIDRATVFKRHRKLRDLKLLARVQPRMIQYRKNIVDNKWIKHRNHTYYEITDKGRETIKIYDPI
jgi:predicted transcriptional regulator